MYAALSLISVVEDDTICKESYRLLPGVKNLLLASLINHLSQNSTSSTTTYHGREATHEAHEATVSSGTKANEEVQCLTIQDKSLWRGAAGA